MPTNTNKLFRFGFFQDENVILFLFAIYPLAILTRATVIFYSLSLILMYVFILKFFYKRGLSTESFIYSKPFYLLFCSFVLSSVCAWYPGHTIFRSLLILSFVWFYYLANTLLIHKRRDWIYKLVLIFCYSVFLCFVFIYAKYGAVRPLYQTMRESIGSFSNVGCAIVILCLPYLIYYFLTKKNRKIVLAGAILSIFASVLLSQSRAGYVFLGTNMILSVLFYKGDFKKRIKTTLDVIFFISIAFFLVVMIYPTDKMTNMGYKVFERFAETSLFTPESYEYPQENMRDYVRVIMIREFANIIKTRPLTGIGYEGIEPYLEEKYGLKDMPSHNILLTVWGEAGILGMIFFCWLVVGAFRRLIKARIKAKKGNEDDFYFYSATIISLSIAIAHAFLRPQLKNPMLYIVLAVAFSINLRASGEIRDV